MVGVSRGALDITPTLLSHAIIAFISATAGLVIGGMLAWSKVGSLYDRLERAEAANREMEQLLREMARALQLDVSAFPSAGAEGAEGYSNGDQASGPLTPAAKLWMYLSKVDLSSPPRDL
jgi:hypothetical protein